MVARLFLKETVVSADARGLQQLVLPLGRLEELDFGEPGIVLARA
jgi:hypothetical protein